MFLMRDWTLLTIDSQKLREDQSKMQSTLKNHWVKQ